MRKYLLLFMLAGSLMLSCKKDRTCECTETYTSSNGTVTTYPNQLTEYKKISKRKAKTLCDNSNYVYVSGSGATSTTKSDCELK